MLLEVFPLSNQDVYYGPLPRPTMGNIVSYFCAFDIHAAYCANLRVKVRLL